MSMSSSELLPGGQGFFGSRFVKAGTLPGPHSPEYVLATGIGSRGGPNKPSNKLRSAPASYQVGEAAAPDYLLATGMRSRGGPNKPSNKLKRTPGAYLYD